MPHEASILVHPEVTDKDIEEGLSVLAWLIEKELESRQKRKMRIQSRLTDKFG